jgi:thymidine phosphorylase
MTDIGRRAEKKCAAVITDMDTPLGRAVGNALEVKESLRALEGDFSGIEDLVEVSAELTARTVALAGLNDYKTARALFFDNLRSGAAKQRFFEMVRRQGGDTEYLEKPEKLPSAAAWDIFTAETGGFVFSTDAETIGAASVILGAGRQKLTDEIDPAAGVIIEKKTGERVKKGDVIARLFTGKSSALAEAKNLLSKAFKLSKAPPEKKPLILDYVES